MPFAFRLSSAQISPPENDKNFKSLVKFYMVFFGDENFWLYLPLIFWIVGIFYLASGKNSIAQTSRVFVPLLNFLFPRGDSKALQNYHVIIRKCGHLAGYAMLALLASIVFYNSSMPSPAKFWYVYAFGVVLIVASLDEIRQSFDPTRVGSFADVALDCIGGMLTIFLFWIFVPNRL